MLYCFLGLLSTMYAPALLPVYLVLDLTTSLGGYWFFLFSLYLFILVELWVVNFYFLSLEISCPINWPNLTF